MPKETAKPQSPESLAKIAKRLNEIAGLLTASAEVMRVNGFESLVVTNYSGLALGMNKVLGFSAAAHKAIQDALEERGDFYADESGNGQHAKAPKRKKPA